MRKLIDFIRKFLGVASPSLDVIRRYGNFGEGIAKGIADSVKEE